MKIFLVGMPGSGKTFFGKRLTEVLEIPLFDLDAVITEGEGLSVTDIFSTKGESHFREMETRYLKQVTSENDQFILSTGGGTPCFHGNMEFMKAEGLTIFLYATEELLIERISRNDKRPLMKDDVTGKVRSLMQTRTPIYQTAHLTLEDRDLEQLVPQIHTFFRN